MFVCVFLSLWCLHDVLGSTRCNHSETIISETGWHVVASLSLFLCAVHASERSKTSLRRWQLCLCVMDTSMYIVFFFVYAKHKDWTLYNVSQFAKCVFFCLCSFIYARGVVLCWPLAPGHPQIFMLSAY